MMLDWLKLPTGWIRNSNGLKQFRWRQGEGADAIAALMALFVIAHQADQKTGEAIVTYEQIADATSLSRAKICNGLSLLLAERIIQPNNQRSRFCLANFNPSSGWAKLPAKPLYDEGGRIKAFFDFNMRKSTELHALKLYLLFAAFRNNATNKAQIGYEKIMEYTGIDKGHIKPALTVLAVQGLVHADHEVSSFGSYGVASQYRLVGLDSYRHNGTTGRKTLENESLGFKPA